MVAELIRVKQVKEYLQSKKTGRSLDKHLSAIDYIPNSLRNLTSSQIATYRQVLYSQGYVLIKLFDTKDEGGKINLSLTGLPQKSVQKFFLKDE